MRWPRVLRSIAAKLHRAPSTVSRELRRNGRGRYRAAAADRRAWHRALRPAVPRRYDQLRQPSLPGSEEHWSPEQLPWVASSTHIPMTRLAAVDETIYAVCSSKPSASTISDPGQCRLGPPAHGRCQVATRSRSANGRLQIMRDHELVVDRIAWRTYSLMLSRSIVRTWPDSSDRIHPLIGIALTLATSRTSEVDVKAELGPGKSARIASR